MYATIRRYAARDVSIDDLADAGYRLGRALSETPGFVAALAVEERNGDLLTIGVFDDRSALRAGEALANRWTLEYAARFGLGTTEVATGEVVAQRGL